MTVSSKVSSIIYNCDGSTTAFDVPFRFLEDSDLQLSVQASDGIVTNLVLNSDYTVTGANADNGGKVHLTHPAPAQSKLSIIRVMDLLQETDYRENERFPAESHERALDKLTMEVQQLQEQSDRSIKLDVFSDVGPDVLIGQVERVWDSIDNIDIVANDKTNMDTVATNIADVNTTATNIANVSTVSSFIGNVNTVANSISNVNTVGTNIADVNTVVTNMTAIQEAPNAASNAANSATDSANSANNSHIWAEGTDAQVQALGGVHSSKGWAEQSTNANISLTNSPYTTNRILEIPQNLQISVNGDTITISGKATRLNGDLVNINVSRTFTGTVGKTYVLISAQPYSSMNTWTFSENNSLASYQQDSQPTITTAYAFWFDTANNRLMFTSNTGSSWYEVVLPFGVAHYTSNGWVIDQVFNGFGYIGSTVFALPGIKVQTPNGRNEDGTYKTVIRTLDSVRTFDAGLWGTKNLKIIFSGGVSSIVFQAQTVERITYNKQFSSSNATYSYDENTGMWWLSTDQSSWTKTSVNILGSCRVESGKITSFEPYTVDSVVNSNASNFSQAGRSYLSGLGMPSNRYIDLTLGASGSTYTAPANGWFVLRKAANSVGQYVYMYTIGVDIGTCFNVSSGTDVPSYFLPVKAGDIVKIDYNLGGATHQFRFIYAEGEEN